MDKNNYREKKYRHLAKKEQRAESQCKSESTKMFDLEWSELDRCSGLNQIKKNRKTFMRAG